MENPGVARSKSSNAKNSKPGLNFFSDQPQPSSRQSPKSRGYSSGCKSHSAYSKSLAPAGHVQKTMKIPVGKVGKCKAIQGTKSPHSSRLPASNLLCGLNKFVKWVRNPRLEQVLVAFPLFLGTKGCRGGNRKSPKSLLNFLSCGLWLRPKNDYRTNCMDSSIP